METQELECARCGVDIYHRHDPHADIIICEPCEQEECCDCGDYAGDGEGYDGLCGNCADKDAAVSETL